MPNRFVVSPDKTGWLVVTLGTQRAALPHMLKVDWLRTEGGRDHFRVQEGAYAGKSGSVVTKGTNQSHLSSTGAHKAAATIRFDRSRQQLWFGGTGPVAAITSPSTPVPAGTFDLEIPDAPHRGGLNYDADYATVWFRILTRNDPDGFVDRYLHAGRATAGCTTVTGIDRWPDIFHYLIDRRKDTKSVGTIQVVA
jgi:hypothetical protein